MLNEQIKKEVSDQVEKKLTDKLDLFNLPLKSQYKMLLFSGRADGTDLVPGFDFQIINNKKVVIKSIKIVPYYFGIGVDISLDDGAGTVINENTYANQRINRLFDDFVSGTRIRFFINGSSINFFPSDGVLYPLDIFAHLKRGFRVYNIFDNAKRK